MLGPFPYGKYVASILADGVKPIKNELPVSIESGQTNELDFSLVPDGMLTVYVTTAIDPENKVVGMPGWERRPQDNTITIQSITLKGAGVSRTFTPVDLENFNWREK